MTVAMGLCSQSPSEDAAEVRKSLEREYPAEDAANVDFYIRSLLEANQLREYNRAGTALQYAGDVEEAERVIQELNGLTVRQAGRKAFTASEAAIDFAERLETRLQAPEEFIRFGLTPLDQELYVQPGDFVVLGGRPSAGKTLLALQFALCMAQSRRVGFVSLETSKEKLAERAISHLSGVPLSKLKKPTELTEAEWAKIAAAEQTFSTLALEIADAGARTVREIRGLALTRRWEVVFIDYLQILTGKGKNRYERVTDISQELHTLAQVNKVCVIALAQLSRSGGAGEPDRPPTLEAFRESGQIEQDADVAMLLYLKNPADKGGERVLKVAKHKEGPLFDCALDFNGEAQAMRYRPYIEAE